MNRLRLLLGLVPAVALAVTLLVVDIGMFAVAPGSAENVFPRIQLDGVRVTEPNGRLLLTTVSIPRATAVDAARAALDPAVELLPEEDVLGGRTPREYERLTRSQMDESKIAAVAIAARELTPYPREHDPGALIQDVVEGSPAEGKVFPGDLVVAADDRRVREVDDLARAIQATDGERPLTLTVEAGGEEHSVRVRPAIPEGEDRPVLGVILIEPFPFEVLIESGEIGGPSAGLMWTLGVYDLLSPDDLVRGRPIAGTGVVSLSGEVFAIGGVAQKVRAAADAGAEVFVVPKANAEVARSVRADIRIVPVDDVADAVRFLRR